jgi:hypothetical protein
MYLLPASTYFPYQPLCILVYRRSLEAHLSRAFSQQGVEPKLSFVCEFETGYRVLSNEETAPRTRSVGFTLTLK